MTRIVDRLEPVLPLDQITRLRLERAVFGKLDLDTSRSPTRWRVAAFAAVVAAAAAVTVMWTWPGRSPTRPAERFASTETALEIAWGDADITIEPGGALVATGDADRGVAIVLERGAAQFDVAKRKERPRFTVIAGDVEVEVVGTRFRVERRADEISVKVSEGVVLVRVDDQQLRLGAGEQWPQPRSAAIPETAAESPPIDDTIAAPPAKRSSSRVQRKQAKADPPPPQVDQPAATQTPAETYAMAARLEATDASAAAKHYAKLAVREDGWGATALYALARLRSDRGDRSTAVRHLRDYLRRFPRGPNVEDARALLARLR